MEERDDEKEKAEEIRRQDGCCNNIACLTNNTKETCPCYSLCNNCGLYNYPKSSMDKKKRIEICEKYLKEHAMEKPVFDKSKVLVAGIHETEAGKRYYLSDYVFGVNILCLESFVRNDAFNLVYDNIINTGSFYQAENGNTFRFAYPYEEPKKTWRPIKTIEEAEPFLGKKIKSKDGRFLSIIIDVFRDNDNVLCINHRHALYYFDNYTMEDDTPVGVEVME